MNFILLLFRLLLSLHLVKIDLLSKAIGVSAAHLNLLLAWERWSASAHGGGAQSLLIHELGVEQNQSLVHDLQGVGHGLVVVLELSQDVLRSPVWQLDQQRFWRFHIIGSYE